MEITGKYYLEGTMSDVNSDKFTFSAWFKDKPKSTSQDWIHVPVQFNDNPENIKFSISYTEEIDGVTFLTTTVTDGNNDLLEKHSIRADRCRG